MAGSSNLSPRLEPFHEDAHVDFIGSSANPAPRPLITTDDDTDHPLEGKLYHAFCAAGYVQLRQVRITQQNGRVKLQGRVPTYFLKQLAQSLASSLPGVEVVENVIEVACPR